MYLHIYIYVYDKIANLLVCMYVHIYIIMYDKIAKFLVCMYVHIYIYMYVLFIIKLLLSLNVVVQKTHKFLPI